VPLLKRKKAAALKPRVLIIVQNLPVPFDRRVWNESKALRDAGYDVTVISLQTKGQPWKRDLEGIRVLTYKPYPDHVSSVGYIFEYTYSFLATLALVLVGRRKGAFAVAQACNPPDIFFPIAWLLKALDGTKFVFDQHDLCPELFESRIGNTGGLYKVIALLEKQTYKAADHVVSTNGSYRNVAMTRGGKRPEDATIVRTGPDPSKLVKGEPDPSLLRGHQYLVAYLGVMGPQDGVDLVVRAADELVHRMGRTDVQFVCVGGGDCLEELKALTTELGLDAHVRFTGRAPDEEVNAVLSTADLGLSPDPKNPLNDVSTMNKTMEYMAFELPVVAFDLIETKVSAEDAAVYVPSPDVVAYAKAISDLLDDPERRAAMGALGRKRVEEKLAWAHQVPGYVAVYDKLSGRAAGS
jgi:glycosyltransferase involved in cell wall biosynthesis